MHLEFRVIIDVIESNDDADFTHLGIIPAKIVSHGDYDKRILLYRQVKLR